MEKIYHNFNQKTAGVVILVSDKVAIRKNKTKQQKNKHKEYYQG